MRLIDYKGLKADRDSDISPLACYYGSGEVVVGRASRIDDGCIVMGNATLGERVHLAPYCLLYGKHGITMGDFSGFGAFSVFHTESDDYSGASLFGPCVPASMKRNDKGPIRIGRGVIFGTRVTVLPNLTIGDGVSVGAHSLIKHDCMPWVIYVGTPAKPLRAKLRDQERLMDHLEIHAEW